MDLNVLVGVLFLKGTANVVQENCSGGILLQFHNFFENFHRKWTQRL